MYSNVLCAISLNDKLKLAFEPLSFFPSLAVSGLPGFHHLQFGGSLCKRFFVCDVSVPAGSLWDGRGTCGTPCTSCLGSAGSAQTQGPPESLGPNSGLCLAHFAVKIPRDRVTGWEPLCDNGSVLGAVQTNQGHI